MIGTHQVPQILPKSSVKTNDQENKGVLPVFFKRFGEEYFPVKSLNGDLSLQSIVKWTGNRPSII